jgi:hypothetical protein
MTMARIKPGRKLRKTTILHDKCCEEAKLYSLRCLHDIVRKLDERITELEMRK